MTKRVEVRLDRLEVGIEETMAVIQQMLSEVHAVLRDERRLDRSIVDLTKFLRRLETVTKVLRRIGDR